MSCQCKESCLHQKNGFCGLSSAERVTLKAKASQGPRGGGSPGG